MMQAHMASVVEINEALGRRFFEAQDRLRGGPVEELCAPEYQAFIGGYPAMDRAGHEGFAKAFYAGFPDMTHQVDQIIATETRVIVRFVLRGTHTGSLFGIPPSGRPAVIAAHIILHVSDGKVTKVFGIFDEAGMLRQIGAIG
jgi:predicted ester cyclase